MDFIFFVVSLSKLYIKVRDLSGGRSRAASKDANCQKMSLYVGQCTYDTQYEGKAVIIIQEIDGQMIQQNAYYSVYFDGVLIRRVTTPLL